MEQLELFNPTNLTSCLAEPRAKTSPHRESNLVRNEEAEREAPLCGHTSILSAILSLVGFSGRMSKAVFPRTADETSQASCTRLANSGILSPIGLLTLNTPEWTHFRSRSPNGDAVCGLSGILEPMKTGKDYLRLSKYFLSLKACLGIIRRCERKGKRIDPTIKNCIECHIKNINDGLYDRIYDECQKEGFEMEAVCLKSVQGTLFSGMDHITGGNEFLNTYLPIGFDVLAGQNFKGSKCNVNVSTTLRHQPSAGIGFCLPISVAAYKESEVK